MGEQPDKRISMMIYGDENGLQYWNNTKNDPMPIKIANGKTLEQCVYYRGGGITVYTDNSVIVKSYPGFYDYYLANERKMSEIMMLPVEGEEIVKDEEYYKKLINGLAVDYNKQVDNAPNLYKNAMVLQDVNTPAPIDFACTVFVDKIWIGEGYSVGTVDRPPCPVNVPTGKLAFETPATGETHSFVMKNAKKTQNKQYGALYSTRDTAPCELAWYKVDGDILFSNLYKEIVSIANMGQSLSGFLSFADNPYKSNYLTSSFTQLLIYKANLTETELKTELAKDIKLNMAYNDYFIGG
ncbi:MAG: hypothetical protein ACRCW1_03050 [Anaerotignaceae bacterium]